MGVRVASGKALVVLVAVFIICASPAAAEEVHLVPAVYVFGDSTVDVGNNKYLPGNYTPPYPYGIDFKGSGPNGRFSNGYNMADSISRLLGFNMSPPAYLSLTTETIGEIGLGGVNYASGGSGILDITGNASFPLSKQVESFADTKSKMIENSGGNSTLDIDVLLYKSLFLISAGGNDMFELLQMLPTDPFSFYGDLRSNYTKHVETLYGLGARRFGVINVPPIGCLPGVRAKLPPGDSLCEIVTNAFAWTFNTVVGEVMEKLALSLPGMRYSVGSSFNLVISYRVRREFKDVNDACCGDGTFNAETVCNSTSTLCDNRDDHLFWDAVHSTEATANKGAEAIYAAPVEKGFASPINFKQLLLDDEPAVSAANLLVSV